MDDASALRITKLNNSNYHLWKFKVEMLLVKDDLWEVVNDDIPAEATDRWRMKDRKARAHIGLLLEDGHLHLVRKQQTDKGMWTILKNYHEKSTLSNKVNLLKKLCSFVVLCLCSCTNCTHFTNY